MHSRFRSISLTVSLLLHLYDPIFPGRIEGLKIKTFAIQGQKKNNGLERQKPVFPLTPRIALPWCGGLSSREESLY